MRRRAVAAATVATALTGALVAAGPAHATFPGTDGLIAYQGFAGPTSQVFTVDPANSPPVTQQITTTGGFQAVNYDASGKVLVADAAPPGPNGIVFLSPQPGTTITPLPGGNPTDEFPAFDPTGTRITFDDGTDIFVQNVDGSGRTNLTSGIPGNLTHPDWSPNGEFIAFDDSTADAIKKINVADGTVTTLTPPAAGCAAASCEEPSVSPDSLHVAYDQGGGAATNGIYDVLASGASADSTRLSTENDDVPAYSPQGNQVAFQDKFGQLAVVPADGSQVVTRIGAFFVGQLSWGAEPLPPPEPPSNEFTFGAVQRNTKKGTAKLTVTVAGPGELTLSGNGVKPQRPAPWAKHAPSKPVAGAGDVVLLIKATGNKKKKLKKNGKVKVKASVTFTPTGGTAATQTKKLKLKRS